MENILITRIKQIMNEKNITPAELSRLTGIRPSSISDYLVGKYMPKQDKIALISDALSVNPGWLMGYEENPKFNFYATAHEQSLIKKYRLISPEGKETVDTILDIQYKAIQPKVKENEAI